MAELIDYDLLGKNIKRICKEKNVSQKELEKRCGFSPSVISTYITGRYSPSVVRLQDIAFALDVDVREFFKKSEDEYYYDEVTTLFCGMSENMKKAVVEIMKVSQEVRTNETN